MRAREDITRAIADAEAKIVEVEESTVFLPEYKEKEIAIQRNFIVQQKDQLAGYDRDYPPPS